MKLKLSFVVCTLALFASTAFPDLIIEEASESTGPAVQTAGRTLTKIKGKKKRIESKQGDSAAYIRIENNATGDQYEIDHAAKTYKFTDGSRKKQGMEMAQAMMANGNLKPTNMPDPNDKTQNRATGNHIKINGYDAEEYVWEKGAQKVTSWFSKDFPNAAKIRAEMEVAEDKSIKWMLAGNFPDLSSVPGIEMRQQIDEKSGTRTITTLVSIKEQQLDDSEFAPPEGYRKIE
jgi:hypothetical protein